MRLITVSEACEALTISRSTLYRLVAAGKLPLVRLSARRVAVPVSALNALVEVA